MWNFQKNSFSFGILLTYSYLFPKEKILEECGVAMAASQKNPNKFGFSLDLHYLFATREFTFARKWKKNSFSFCILLAYS